MKRDRHIGAYFKWAVCAGILLVAGCTYDDEVATTEVMKSDVVTFGIRMSNEWKPDVIGGAEASRASAASKGGSGNRSMALPMECVEGTAPVENIYMYVVEEDCPAVVDTMSVRSRAEGDETTPKTPLFGVFAFEVPDEKVTDKNNPTYNASDALTSPFMNNVGVVKENENVYIPNGQQYYWPGAGSWLQFYAYQPYAENDTMSISDNSPMLNYTVPTDVSKQKDWAIGASSMLNGNSLKPVEMTLKRIMSKVQIKQGSIAIGKITSISFSGIKNIGTYSFNGETWTLTEDSTTFSQSFEDGYVAKEDQIVGSPFLLMPQNFYEEASINITLKVETDDPHNNGQKREDTYTLTKSLSKDDFLPGGFVQNKQYTFIITTPQQVDVTVDDKVTDNVKHDVVIKNIGLSPAYIRAAIVGNWVTLNSGASEYTEENVTIVADWEPKDDEFDWGTPDGLEHPVIDASIPSINLKNRWFKCSDGYYYYLGIVNSGQELKNLFTSYTLKQSAPMANAFLELTIAVQAVYPDDVKSLWKEEVQIALGIAEDDAL